MGRGGGKILTMLLGSMVLSITSAWARPDDSGTWGEAIMPQPFDTGPFRADQDSRMGPGDHRLRLHALGDGRSGRRAAAATRRDDQRDGLRRSVLCLLRQQAPQEAQPARPARPAGARTSPNTSGWASASWASIPRASRARSTRPIPTGGGSRPNTTEIPQIDMKKYPHGGMLCLLGPYGDFFIDVLAEILTRFPDVDAFSFDGLHYGGVCYCQHCRDDLPQGRRAPRSPTPT